MSTLFTATINGKIFNFQPVEIGDEVSYHVDVKDDDGVRWEFRMQKNEAGKWEQEGQKLPAWVMELQDALVSAIEKHD